jgi:glutathione synthase/RimK-type ligase-like ATP-grasp enzyme
MILIVSSILKDDHAQPVMDAITRLGGQYVLLDLSEYPLNLFLTIEYDGDGGLPTYGMRRSGPGVDPRLADCRVAWWRRPQAFTMHTNILDAAASAFAYQECYQALNGLWPLLDVFWVNNPECDELAGRKPYQLKLAREMGLETPATLITSDPVAARAFVERYGPERIVYKSFLATPEAWRETRILRPDEVAALDSVAYAPVIFQEFVPADLDLRITIIGDQIFPTAIDTSATSYHVDYRITMDDGRVEPFELPDTVASLLRAYLDRLGLVYGAIDMRLTPDGRFVFLEVNPSGQWIFMEERTGVPMTEAFARLLIAHDRP